MTDNLFETAKKSKKNNNYDASSIRVLEGLEPVRLRPGMYIGGTDSKALHHLFSEIIDNSMDEVVAGHAKSIEIYLDETGFVSIADDGRGIPVEQHPQIPKKSTLEVILTQLHSGGKFDGSAYETSGGLHGVGLSVVNALSDQLEIETIRDRILYKQKFSRGIPQGSLEIIEENVKRKGTLVRFHPDPEIFGEKAAFTPKKLFQIAQAKAYLFGGVKIKWRCAPELLEAGSDVPLEETFFFAGGLFDYLQTIIDKEELITENIFNGKTKNRTGHGAVEWAVAWSASDNFVNAYCNTVPTPDGGTHVNGLRSAFVKSLKHYGELTNNKRAATITAEDVMLCANAMLSVFIREPEFVGQTKDKLSSLDAYKIVENSIKDSFDHWLINNSVDANKLIEWIIDRAEERIKRRQEKENNKKNAVKRWRLPSKLADCNHRGKNETELFIVEGDSAGGSAKQARDRNSQAVLPLRGKILNVASATKDKINTNQLLADVIQALGCGTGNGYKEEDLRYDRIIIMTDADVDGAHIASLLLTFFYQQMSQLIENGHLFLAVPPLYKLSQGGKILYARDDKHKNEILADYFKAKDKIEISRFKGLGEMRASQLKETTMDPAKRTILQININDLETEQIVDDLMGTRPEARFAFIQKNAVFVENLDV